VDTFVGSAHFHCWSITARKFGNKERTAPEVEFTLPRTQKVKVPKITARSCCAIKAGSANACKPLWVFSTLGPDEERTLFVAYLRA